MEKQRQRLNEFGKIDSETRTHLSEGGPKGVSTDTSSTSYIARKTT
jgi:hypothetical protein